MHLLWLLPAKFVSKVAYLKTAIQYSYLQFLVFNLTKWIKKAGSALHYTWMIYLSIFWEHRFVAPV